MYASVNFLFEYLCIFFSSKEVRYSQFCSPILTKCFFFTFFLQVHEKNTYICSPNFFDTNILHHRVLCYILKWNMAKYLCIYGWELLRSYFKRTKNSLLLIFVAKSHSCTQMPIFHLRIQILKNFNLSTYLSGLSQAGGLGAQAPQFLVDQLTLSQPGGQIIPTTILLAPPDFQTLRRAWIIQVQNGNGVIKMLVPCLKCLELVCWVLQASLNKYY